MRNFYLSTLLFVFSTFNLFSQISAGTYSFSSLNETYSEITGTLSTATGDDGTQSVIPIGFAFNYCGTNYSTVNVSTNGAAYFGTSFSYSNDLSSSTYKLVIAPLWDDLYDDENSDISYTLSGTSPDRIFTIQWKNLLWGRYTTGSALPTYRVNFQIQLYETSNIIKIAYGQNNAPGSERTPSATIGINDQTGGSSHFMSITPGIIHSVSTTTSNNSINVVTDLIAGLTFIFIPPSPCINPINQPTALNLSAGSTAAFGTFTAASGVDGYLVVGTNTPPLIASPIDGNSYVAGTVLGNGIVLQSGITNTFNATGLIENTTYTVYVFAMNSQCTGGPKYNIIDPLSGSITTGPVVPALFTATAISSSQINLTATANTQNDNVVIAWNNVNTFGNPTGSYTAGESVIGGGNVFYVGSVTGLVNHTGLNSSTMYYYRAWSVNSSNLYSNGLSASDTTFCSSISNYPVHEGFESIPSAGSLPLCWSKTSTKWNTNIISGTYGRNPRTGSNYAYCTWSANDWLFSPALQLMDVIGYKFSLWYVTDGYSGWDTLEVRYGNAPNAASMTNLIVRKTNPNNTVYQELTDVFSPNFSGDYYIGIRVKANSAPWYLTIDDISFSVLAAPVADFTADLLNPIVNQTVVFTDQSLNDPASWQWTVTPATSIFVDATNSNTQNPHIQFTASGFYSVKLKVTNSTGLDSITKTDYINVVIPANAPVASFSEDQTIALTSDTVIFTDMSINTPTSWNWTFIPNTVTFLSGTSANSQNPQVQFNSAGTYTVQLTASNAAGSDDTVKVSLINVTLVYCTPTYTTGTSGGDYIGGVSLNSINNITIGALTPFYTYYDLLNANLIIGASDTITLTNGNYSGTLAAWIDFNANGLFDTGEKLGESTGVAIGGIVNIPFVVPVTSFAGVTRLRVREVYSYSNISPCLSYTYGETEDYNVTLIAPSAPVSYFTADNLSPIIDQTVIFTDTSINYPTSWQWFVSPATTTFVDGTNSNSQNPHIQFSTTGLYTVSLKASNTTGFDSIAKVNYINVVLPTVPPIAYFYSDFISTSANQIVTLFDTSTQIPTAWDWTITPNTFTFVNGTTAASQNPQVNFSAAGLYSVQLIASNYAGSSTLVKTNYISVVAEINMTDATIQTCDMIFYDSGGQNGDYSINEDFTLVVQPDIFGNKVKIHFNSFNTEAGYDSLSVYMGSGSDLQFVGKYQGTSVPADITSTATDGSLTFHFKSDGIIVKAGWIAYLNCFTPPLPVADFYADNVNPIIDQIVTLSDSTQNDPVSWLWNIVPATFTFVNGTNANSQNPQVSFQGQGAYTVTLIVTNNVGQDDTVKTNFINVLMPPNPPTPFFNATDTTIITNQIISLIDASIDIPTSWAWNIVPSTINYMNGTNASSQNPDIQFTASGSYTITLIVTNAAGSAALTKTDYIIVTGAVNITNTTITTCSSIIYDSGGSNGNYLDGESTTMIIQPAIASNVIQLSFSWLDLELGLDNLKIYNGSGTSGTLIGTYTGISIPPTLVSSASDGALTMVFTSNGQNTATGWDAYAGCVIPPTKSLDWSDTVFTEANANNGTFSANLLLSLTNETFATTGTFTEGVQYLTANVPVGLSVQIASTSTSTVTVSLIGTAVNHASANDVNNLTINFLDAAFSGNNASIVGESSKNDLQIHFHDNYVIPDIVITEIMYRSPLTPDSLEYIEIYNHGASAVDISNYYFVGVTVVFPNATILNPGGFLVVSKNSTALFSRFGVNSIQWNSGTTANFTLSNTGEVVALKSYWGATVDSVMYGNTAPWPTQAAGNGASIVLCDPASDNTLATNWKASASATSFVINTKILSGSPGTLDNACQAIDFAVISPSGNFDFCNGISQDTVTAVLQNAGLSNISTGTVVNLTYKVDAGSLVSQNFTTTSVLQPGNTWICKFTQTVDLSVLGNHSYNIYLSTALDANALNDSTIGIASHIILSANIVGGDTIHTGTLPYTLSVSDIYNSYLWSNTNGSLTGTNATFDVNSYGWYHVTVNNLNGCSDIDSVYVGNIMNSANDIISFTIPQQAGSATINTTTQTVSIQVTAGTLLTALVPTIAVSQQATINPSSGTIQNFTSPVTYTVTAEDGTTQTWVVTVTVLPAQSSANDIISFALPQQTGAATINSTAHTVTIQVAAGTSLSALIPTISVSSFAAINPVSGVAQNFTVPFTYTVTAQNGTTQTWVVTVTVLPAQSSAKDIISFTLPQQTGAATINTITHTVAIQVLQGTSLTALIPAINVSPLATINPASGVVQNFTTPFSYTVTAQNGTTQTWVVTVTVSSTQSSAKDIISFTLLQQTGPATINTTNHTVSIVVISGTLLTSLTPSLTVSQGATINPASGVAQNFTAPFTYTVTAQNGTSQAWVVIVTISSTQSSANEIVSFTMPQQTGAATINTTNNTVSIVVLNGTSVTLLIPIITVSAGASINPISNVSQNFTSPVTYTVTAQNGTTRTWVVTVFVSPTQSSAHDIVTFTLPQQTGVAVVNTINHTVSIVVSNGTILTSLTPTITVSAGATINPVSGVSQNFIIPFTYTVTAQNGTTQTWVVTVSQAPSSANDILSFTLPQQTDLAVINTSNHTVTIMVSLGTLLTSLTPAITISPLATISPAGSVSQNFSNPFSYTVTSQNGSTQTWVVTVTTGVGISEVSSSSFRVNMYPNPAKSVVNFTIENNFDRTYFVEVVNVIGQTVYTKSFLKMENAVQMIDLTGNENGIYFIKFQSDKQSSIHKIIKN